MKSLKEMLKERLKEHLEQVMQSSTTNLNASVKEIFEAMMSQENSTIFFDNETKALDIKV